MVFRRTIQHGEKIGRTLGFPTLNFNVGRIGQHVEKGVYACCVRLKNLTHSGALYFGPKTPQGPPVLELHLLNFKEEVYGEKVTIHLGPKIRPPRFFKSLQALAEQIKKDVEAIKAILATKES